MPSQGAGTHSSGNCRRFSRHSLLIPSDKIRIRNQCSAKVIYFFSKKHIFVQTNLSIHPRSLFQTSHPALFQRIKNGKTFHRFSHPFTTICAPTIWHRAPHPASWPGIARPVARPAAGLPHREAPNDSPGGGIFLRPSPESTGISHTFLSAPVQKRR